jgi:hypothetical protein
MTASFVLPKGFEVAGILGAFIAGKPGERNKARFIVGATAAAVGQSCISIAYTAFIVLWTHYRATGDGFVGFVVWPFAFMAVFVPIWLNLIRTRVEARDRGHSTVGSVALHVTLVVTVLVFVLLAFGIETRVC